MKELIIPSWYPSKSYPNNGSFFKEQAEALLEKVEETYGDCDVQLEYGGQPIYYFLLSVE